MDAIRDVQFETYGNEYKSFEIKVFFAFRKAPVILYFNTGHSKTTIISNILNFARDVNVVINQD